MSEDVGDVKIKKKALRKKQWNSETDNRKLQKVFQSYVKLIDIKERLGSLTTVKTSPQTKKKQHKNNCQTEKAQENISNSESDKTSSVLKKVKRVKLCEIQTENKVKEKVKIRQNERGNTRENHLQKSISKFDGTIAATIKEDVSCKSLEKVILPEFKSISNFRIPKRKLLETECSVKEETQKSENVKLIHESNDIANDDEWPLYHPLITNSHLKIAEAKRKWQSFAFLEAEVQDIHDPGWKKAKNKILNPCFLTELWGGQSLPKFAVNISVQYFKTAPMNYSCETVSKAKSWIDKHQIISLNEIYVKKIAAVHRYYDKILLAKENSFKNQQEMYRNKYSFHKNCDVKSHNFLKMKKEEKERIINHHTKRVNETKLISDYTKECLNRARDEVVEIQNLISNHSFSSQDPIEECEATDWIEADDYLHEMVTVLKV